MDKVPLDLREGNNEFQRDQRCLNAQNDISFILQQIFMGHLPGAYHVLGSNDTASTVTEAQNEKYLNTKKETFTSTADETKV